MNTSIVAAPESGASLAEPGPSPEPLFVTGRPDVRHLRWGQYVALIHGAESRSVAVMTHFRYVGKDAAGKDEYRTASAGATGPEIIETVGRLRPRFVTINGFRTLKPRRDGKDYHDAPCKALWNLASLNGIWLDLDFYKPRCAYRNQTKEGMVEILIDRLRNDLMWPMPSIIMSSGKGLFALWLHDALPSSALPVWKACQASLNCPFADMGRDLQAIPATSNFRVPGSLNDGHSVEVLWPRYVDEVVRHDFQVLRDALLPYTADQVKAHREAATAKKAERDARRAEKAARGETTGPRVKLNRATYAAALSKDLNTLFESRFEGQPVSHGERDTWLYHLAAAAAWVRDPDALKAEIERLAPLCGLTVVRARTLMGSVLRKARKAASGGTDTRKGRPTDPRYRCNPGRLVDVLGVTVEEATRLNLRVIVPRALKVAREAERSQQRRRDSGATPRSAAQAERLEFGRYALERHAAGALVDELAFEAKARFAGKGSRSWVEKAMREARAVVIGRPQAKSKAGRSARAQKIDPSVSTGSIIAAPRGLDAVPTPVVARDASGYTGGVHGMHLMTTDQLEPARPEMVAAGFDASGESIDDRRYRHLANGTWAIWDDGLTRWRSVPADDPMLSIWRMIDGEKPFPITEPADV